MPRKYYEDQIVSQTIDVEFQAFEVDVIGLFNFLRSSLHSGDKLHGTVTVTEDKTELMISLESVETKPVTCPWVAADQGHDLQGLIEAVSYQIALDFHQESNPQLEGLTYRQFQQFVEGLDRYHALARLSGDDSRSQEAARYLTSAERNFKALVRDKPENSLIYSYMASILGLKEGADPKEIRKLLETAISLDSANTFATNYLAEVKPVEDTQSKQAESVEAEDGFTLADIKSQTAFEAMGLDQLSGGRNRVRVAVLGTGVDSVLDDHVIASDEANFVADEGPVDENGSGTTVAAILTAIAPQADIVSVKVLSRNGVGSFTAILEGIQYAIDNQVDILFMPLSSSANSEALEQAVKQAAQANILMIAGSGNQGNETRNYPAAYDPVVSVGATTLDGKVASFSGSGDWVKVYTLGVDIQTIGLNGKRVQQSGTSFASAIVTGVAALMKSIRPELTPDQLQTTLIETSQLVGSNQHNIDPQAAVTAVQNMR